MLEPHIEAILDSGAPMTAGYGGPAAGGERGKLRAADADRDRASGLLNTAYVEGRLSRDEYDARLESALTARTYAELDQVVADLPGAFPPAVVPPEAPLATPVRETNGLAVASLACGVGQFVVGPLATIPAIVLGHVARRQIRRNGQQGGSMALAGLLLGWGAVVLGIVIALVAVIAFAQMNASGGVGP